VAAFLADGFVVGFPSVEYSCLPFVNVSGAQTGWFGPLSGECPRCCSRSRRSLLARFGARVFPGARCCGASYIGRPRDEVAQGTSTAGPKVLRACKRRVAPLADTDGLASLVRRGSQPFGLLTTGRLPSVVFRSSQTVGLLTTDGLASLVRRALVRFAHEDTAGRRPRSAIGWGGMWPSAVRSRGGRVWLG
jgi:hypothetical protein